MDVCTPSFHYHNQADKIEYNPITPLHFLLGSLGGHVYNPVIWRFRPIHEENLPRARPEYSMFLVPMANQSGLAQLFEFHRITRYHLCMCFRLEEQRNVGWCCGILDLLCSYVSFIAGEVRADGQSHLLNTCSGL